MKFLSVLLIIIFPLAVTSRHAAHAEEKTKISNGYFQVEASGGKLFSLRCDPDGKGKFSRNILHGYRYEGIDPCPSTTVISETENQSLIWTNLEASVMDKVSISRDCSIPEEVLSDRPLGQKFQVPGQFDMLQVKIPTWHSTTSGVTIQLLKEGEIVAEQQFESIADNASPMFMFEPQPAGEYEVRLINPVGGRIGWWSSDSDVYESGTATIGGEPVEGSDRWLEVPFRRLYSDEAQLQLKLDGPRMMYSLTVPVEEGAPDPEQVMNVYWEKDGYDTSSQATPFKRFYSDFQRLMPVEQLKRVSRSDRRLNWHERFYIDGTMDFDFNVQCSGPGSMRWQMTPDMMSLYLQSGPKQQDGKKTYSMLFEVQPRQNHFPAEWPRFETSDISMNEDLNLMHYERNFSYPSPCGPAPWIEWSAIARSWIGGPAGDGEKRHVADIVMDETGYVYTWGGNAGWPFPDNHVYDTRHFDTNARFISAFRRHYLWTRDEEYLKGQIHRLRKAMEYQLKVLKGEEGLIVSVSEDVNGKHMGVGNNYWDILPFGHLDAYANAIFYESLQAMAEIEECYAAIGADVKDSISGRAPEFYRQHREKVKKAYNETFWDDEKGRYIGCVDIDGQEHDYGFTFVNLETIYYGLASPEQVKRIYDWMENGKSSTGEADIYSAWIFAPRATTIHNPMWNRENPDGIEEDPMPPWWHFGWLGTPFGDQCQDGGAIFYTSYFDLMNRSEYLGADNAHQRWSEILQRYRMPDRMCGGGPLSRGENPQRADPGSVGLDVPFPESGMVPCYFLYGVLGLQPEPEGLVIRPNLPSSLDYCTVRNVRYGDKMLTIRATRDDVKVEWEANGEINIKSYPLSTKLRYAIFPGE